jgi:hypothetical protein
VLWVSQQILDEEPATGLQTSVPPQQVLSVTPTVVETSHREVPQHTPEVVQPWPEGQQVWELSGAVHTVPEQQLPLMQVGQEEAG